MHQTGPQERNKIEISVSGKKENTEQETDKKRPTPQNGSQVTQNEEAVKAKKYLEHGLPFLPGFLTLHGLR